MERIKTYERLHRPPSRKKRQRKKMVEEREREREKARERDGHDGEKEWGEIEKAYWAKVRENMAKKRKRERERESGVWASMYVRASALISMWVCVYAFGCVYGYVCVWMCVGALERVSRRNVVKQKYKQTMIWRSAFGVAGVEILWVVNHHKTQINANKCWRGSVEGERSFSSKKNLNIIFLLLHLFIRLKNISMKILRSCNWEKKWGKMQKSENHPSYS